MRAIPNIPLFVLVSAVLLNTPTGCDGARTVLEYYPDQLAAADLHTKAVYNGVLNLLVHKMKSWLSLKNHQSTSIARYLGFPPETVNLINGALTILVARKYDAPTHPDYWSRRHYINMNNLVEAYFYSCDVAHMVDPTDAHRSVSSAIAENFHAIFRYLRIDERRHVVDDYEEEELVDMLQSYVDFNPEPVELSHGMTVEMITNSLFLDESSNATVNRLRTRFQEDAAEMRILKDFEVHQVYLDHGRFLAKIIPDLFGFAYNHVELLTKLLKYDLTDPTKSAPVTYMTDFLLAGVHVLLKRYYRFRNRPFNRSVSVALTPLIRFFDPFGTVDRGAFFSIFDTKSFIRYFNNKWFDKSYMWLLMNNALAAVLREFEKEETTIDVWKEQRTIRVQYPDDADANPNTLTALMRANTSEAIEFYELLRSNLVR